MNRKRLAGQNDKRSGHGYDQGRENEQGKECALRSVQGTIKIIK